MARFKWDNARGCMLRFNEDTGEWIKTNGFDPNAPPTRFMVMADLEQHYGAPIISPIDGMVISSRSHLRRHERTHNVRHGGDYKPGELVAKAKRARETKLARQDRKGVKFAWQ